MLLNSCHAQRVNLVLMPGCFLKRVLKCSSWAFLLLAGLHEKERKQHLEHTLAIVHIVVPAIELNNAFSIDV